MSPWLTYNSFLSVEACPHSGDAMAVRLLGRQDATRPETVLNLVAGGVRIPSHRVQAPCLRPYRRLVDVLRQWVVVLLEAKVSRIATPARLRSPRSSRTGVSIWARTPMLLRIL